MFLQRIKKILNRSVEVDFNPQSKLFIFSDCHRGAGDSADDFAHNHDLFLYVLKQYMALDYTLIELGDGDELWENRRFSVILENYRDIFSLYESLYKSGKFYYIWGNHNRKWNRVSNLRKSLSKLLKSEHQIETCESIRLIYNETTKFFLIHGHQGEWYNDQFWWIGRFIVRMFWTPIQKIFKLPDVTRTAINHKARIRADKRFIKWVKKSKIPTIIGHTHRPVFPRAGQKPYFNTGSCIHPEGISGIEISDFQISLVTWNRNSSPDKPPYKKVLAGPRAI